MHRDALGLPPAIVLSGATVTAFRDGTVVQLAERLGALPVEGREVAVTLDGLGFVRGVRLDPAPAAVAPIAHEIGAAAAAAAVTARFGAPLVGRATRVAFWRGAGPAREAWRFPVVLIPWVAHFTVWVDAATGAILGQAPVSNDQPIRRLEVAR